ncbi:MAG: ATP-dependent DNA helicase [Clostridia bacterium]|nr:ATP-dependent DNA helicase [Clostridia bacterium]
MAKAVSDAVDRESILIAEAGVGTGKTLAYLVPAIVKKYSSGNSKRGPLVVSTKTISLQEQLYYKDIPAVQRMLLGAYGFRVPDPLLSKGKRNYCCPVRLDALLSEQRSGLDSLLSEVQDWLCRTGTADFGEPEAPLLPEEVRESLAVAACSDGCSRSHRCAYRAMRSKRSSFRGIIVTNHNQLVNDLILRQQTGRGLWPSPFAVIIDEAHGLEDVARSELAQQVSPGEIQRLIVRITPKDRPWSEEIEHRAQAVKRCAGEVAAGLDRSTAPALQTGMLLDSPRIPLSDTPELAETVSSLASAMESFFGSVKGDTRFCRPKKPKTRRSRTRKKPRAALQRDLAMTRLKAMAQAARQAAKALRESSCPPEYAVWAEKGPCGADIVVAPLDVGKFLKKNLWAAPFPVVLTSGTIAVSGSTKLFRDGLGLSSALPVVSKKYPSPFNYRQKVLIYIPKDLPIPRAWEVQPESEEESDEFALAAAERLEELLVCSRGRALALFTSYRRLNTAYQRLSRAGLGFKVLRQGEAGPGELLKQFRDDTSSVLLATGSFWEGVDAPGETLSLLVMDKLPFPLPSDPLVKAMVDRAKAYEKDPYEQVILPHMLRALRQGSGRLIRQAKDTGVIAVLDARAWREKYHALVKDHLPDAPWTASLDEVRRWFKKGASHIRKEVRKGQHPRFKEAGACPGGGRGNRLTRRL